jgi:hypothetical protein
VPVRLGGEVPAVLAPLVVSIEHRETLLVAQGVGRQIEARGVGAREVEPPETTLAVDHGRAAGVVTVTECPQDHRRVGQLESVARHRRGRTDADAVGEGGLGG